mgnify:CR=1 FL=1
MAARGHTDGPALGEFLSELRSRWEPLSREDLVAVLGSHAERLPVRDRQAFLDVFPGRAAPLGGAVRTSGVQVLARIDAFAARVAAGEYADDEGYYHDRYGWVDEEAATWAPEAAELFAAVGELFVAGDLVAARAAYERLLVPFGLGGDDDWTLELWELESSDVSETLARYLRCVYETTAVAGRVEAVHRIYLELPSVRPLTLAQLSSTRLDPLPDLDAFLPGWIDALLANTNHPRSPDRVRLLAEAAMLHAGVDGLADLLRRAGPHQGGIGLARIDALTAAGRLVDARAVAQEALDLSGASDQHRAEAADRLAVLAGQFGDVTGAVAARRRAWTSQPTRPRLLAMAATSIEAGVLLKTLAAEADVVSSAGGVAVDRLGCELLLLAGRLDQAVGELTTSSPLGWHSADHPGPVVLPVLWAAATGAAPALDAGHLGQLFAAIDIEPRALPSVDDWLPASVDGSPARSGPPAPASPQLTDLLADAIARLVGDSVARDTDTRDAGTRDAGTRDTWLTIAGTVADARINAIVSGKHRGAYARAASLAYAHAEALAGVGREAEARGYLEGVRARFPRHIAFRGEFDAAASASTLRPRRR